MVTRQLDAPLGGQSQSGAGLGCPIPQAACTEAVMPLSLPPRSALLFSLALLPAKFPSQAKSFHRWAWPQSEILRKLSAEFI